MAKRKTLLSPEAQEYVRYMMAPKPSYCCQTCGECVGWVGRFLFPFLHDCKAWRYLRSLFTGPLRLPPISRP